VVGDLHELRSIGRAENQTNLTPPYAQSVGEGDQSSLGCTATLGRCGDPHHQRFVERATNLRPRGTGADPDGNAHGSSMNARERTRQAGPA